MRAFIVRTASFHPMVCLMTFALSGTFASAQATANQRITRSHPTTSVHSSLVSKSWSIGILEGQERLVCDPNEWPYVPCTTLTASRPAAKPTPNKNSVATANQTLTYLPVLKPPVLRSLATRSSAGSNEGVIQTITLPDAPSRTSTHYTLDELIANKLQRLNRSVRLQQAPQVLSAIPPKAAYSYAPGSGQKYVMDEQAHAPVVSSPTGTYTGKQTLMLTSTTPGAAIYYTMNGGDPATESTLYSEPITLLSSATIKAVAIAKGLKPSNMTVAQYTITPPALLVEISANGRDSVNVTSKLQATGAASVEGKWSITEGNNQLCSADQTTQTTWHCPVKLTKGVHKLKATYSGVNNGWRLVTDSTLKVK